MCRSVVPQVRHFRPAHEGLHMRNCARLTGGDHALVPHGSMVLFAALPDSDRRATWGYAIAWCNRKHVVPSPAAAHTSPNRKRSRSTHTPSWVRDRREARHNWVCIRFSSNGCVCLGWRLHQFATSRRRSIRNSKPAHPFGVNTPLGELDASKSIKSGKSRADPRAMA